MPDESVMVRLDKVSKSYGSVRALGETSLDVRQGEFLTLLGPSGSGKTTILNLVAGMVSTTSGRIHIAGRDVTDLPPNKRDLGMVFQHYALMPHMTIFENIAFPLRVRKVSRGEIKRRVGEVLELVRLAHIGSRKPSELSGGQQQRIAIARCLVYNPSIILMDEPLGALDKKLREEMQLELKRLHAELGITALYVTHDQEEALTMSDRIILMKGGYMEQIGTPADLYSRPKSVFAARFLGDSNIVEGTVAAVGETVAVDTALGKILTARPDHTLSVGDHVSILVRPENVLLGEAASGAVVNRVTGNMINDIAYGGVTKSFVSVSGDQRFIAQQLTRSDRASPRSNTEISITFAPRDALVLPPEAAPSEPEPSTAEPANK